MKFCRIIFCLWLLVCFFPIGIHADIQLPSILSDNMVLQQNAKVRFWGKARPGAVSYTHLTLPTTPYV